MAEQVYTNLTNNGPVSVYVRDGKIVRIRPLVIDEKDWSGWTIEANGETYVAPKRVTIAPQVYSERRKMYTEDRILQPMKRVDFDVDGERHPENRGKSGYVPISWDEALETVAKEMKRIRSEHGPSAIGAVDMDHHNRGIAGYRFGPYMRFFNTLGFTEIVHNPDSWEGWHWGATHAYGFWWRLGMAEQTDLLEEALKYSELLVYWSSDPDSTQACYSGPEAAIWLQWLKRSGKRQLFIDPFCNYTAAVHANKWIAPRPGTDAALAEAIASVWFRDGTYDKEYLETHAVGQEQFEKHIRGEEDGIPRTPEWAAEITGIPARTIEALAKEWGSKRTMLVGVGLGSACRAAYAHEWARLLVLLQAMQGLGKPGVGMWQTHGAPANYDVYFPGYADADAMYGFPFNRIAKTKVDNPVKQKLYRILVPDSILNPPVRWMGEGFCGQALEQQFTEFVYPAPGCSEIKMYYTYGGASMGTMTNGNKRVEMFQSPKLECVVTQDCWWHTETKFCDIILPACTNFEREDLAEWGEAGGYVGCNATGCNHRVIVYEQKCIEPLGESKSDYWIFSQLADRLGFGETFTDGGRTEGDWIRALYECSDLPQFLSFDEFREKGYFVVPVPEPYKSTPALRWFYEGRPCDTPDAGNPKKGTPQGRELGTYSGKIEFESQSLKQNLPDDQERPPVPRYIASWEGHTSELAQKYPLQMISPHPRYSFHSHYDKRGSWIWDIPGHRVAVDGYYYQTMRINPVDAAARGIQNRDIVRLFNDRGSVLCCASVTERMKPGVVHSYCSSGQYDPLEPGKPGSTDRGGCVNLLTSDRIMSKNVPGMAPNSCLIEVEKWAE
jgi:molybdopterin guanine dinucleotide-containing S/N-oxide reductase-like protein